LLYGLFEVGDDFFSFYFRSVERMWIGVRFFNHEEDGVIFASVVFGFLYLVGWSYE